MSRRADVAKFARARWASAVNEKTKAVVVPGLGSAAARAPATPFSAVPVLHEGTAQEIVVLYSLTQDAQTRALLSATSTGGAVHPRFEAEKLAGDMLAAADSYLDDGVENDDDARLRAVRDAHANDASTDAALAGALHDYAALVETLLPGIDGRNQPGMPLLELRDDFVGELPVGGRSFVEPLPGRGNRSLDRLRGIATDGRRQRRDRRF